ncbi:unnamed protein product [Absidia cylindrospora]
MDSDSDTGYHILSHQHQDGSDFGGGGRSIISQQRAMFAEMRRSSREGYTLPPPMPYHYSAYGWPKTMIDHDSIWPPPPHPPPSIQAPIPLIPTRSTSSTSSSQQHMSYHQQRLSESPMSSSSSTSTTDSSSHNASRKRPRTAPKVQFHPYPYNGKHRRHSATDDDRYVLRPLYPKQGGDDDDDDDDDHDNDDDDGNDARMILPRLATYLVAHPDEPPENYFLHHRHSFGYSSSHQQEPMAQKRALTWPTLPGTTEKTITRRLSVQDLCNPIECLERSSSSSPFPSSANNNNDNDNSNNDAMHLNKTDDKGNKTTESMEPDAHDTTLAPVKQEEGIDLTLDEYEAIQGFGRFQKYGGLK